MPLLYEQRHFLHFTMTDLIFSITAGTDVGLVRTNNEDNFIVNPDLSSSDWFLPEEEDKEITLGPYGALMVVADGMGGMNAGEVASAIAVDTVKSYFSPEKIKDAVGDEDKILSMMSKAVTLADKNIKKRAEDDSSSAGMGTTIVMAWIYDARVYVCWCGDSRAYLFNPDRGLIRLSKDHSYVQQLVDEGKLDSELAFDHPNSNIITRSLGDSPVVAHPDVVSRSLSEGDMVLLCTDGLCGLCRDEQIHSILSKYSDNVEECRAQLTNASLINGGHDNVTLSIFKTISITGASVADSDISGTNFEKHRPAHSTRCVFLFISVVLLILVVCCIKFFSR